MSLKIEVIKHWKENLDKVRNRELPHINQSYCAYCQKYYDDYSINLGSREYNCCSGCPIAGVTGKQLCRGTPYYQVLELTKGIPFHKNKHTWPTLIKAVKAEIEFLKSLPDDQEE